MSTWLWIIVIAFAIVVVAAVVMAAARHRRTTELRTGFGPEYDRTLERTGDTGQAEADLRNRREAEHDELELRRLDPRAHVRASSTAGRPRRRTSSTIPRVPPGMPTC